MYSKNYIFKIASASIFIILIIALQTLDIFWKYKMFFFACFLGEGYFINSNIFTYTFRKLRERQGAEDCF